MLVIFSVVSNLQRLALHWTFLCHTMTCNDVCNINQQMKLDFIFIYLITRISTEPITEYLNKHDTCFAYTLLICKKEYNIFYISEERREIIQLKSYISTFQTFSTFCM